MSSTAQFLTDAEGKRTAVLLPIEQYENMLEDLHDLATIAERKDEATIPLEEFKAELERDGLI